MEAGSMEDREKKSDPRKEILVRQIGAKIAYYRTLRDMSQKELARKASISTSSLSKIERGKYNDNISVSLLMDIADGLQIDLTLLVTFSDLEKNMWWKPIHD
jgi:transcriptional regulator with XRE-family HTH domain